MIQNLKNLSYRLLRRSERYTKTDMVYVAKGSVWLGLGQVILTSLAFVSGLVFANWLTPEQYGTYRYIFTLYSFFTVLSLVEMGTSVVRAVSRGREASLLQAVRAKIKWGLLGSVVGIGTALYYYFIGNTVVAWGCLIASLCLPLVETFGMYESVQSGRRQFDAVTKYRLSAQILNSTLTLLSLLFSRNILVVVSVYFVSWMFTRLYLYTRVLKKQPLNDQVDPDVVTYGKHLSFIKGLSIAVGNTSNFFLYQLLGPAGLALYAVAVAPSEHIRRLLNMVGSLAMPKMSSDDWKLINLGSFIHKFIPFGLILILISVGYILIANPLYRIFFPQYTEAIWLSQWYAVTILFTGLNIILGTILKAKQKIKELHILNGVDTALQIFPTLPFIYWFGVFGLILSVLITKIVEAFVMLYLLFSRSEKKIKSDQLN